MSERVHHWETEDVQELPFESIDTLYRLFIRVVSEVPIDAEGNRLPRHGNRYFPTLVSLGGDTDERPAPSLTPDDCRVLSTQLLAAAALAESIDAPDTWPRCGHWIGTCDGRCKDRRP